MNNPLYLRQRNAILQYLNTGIIPNANIQFHPESYHFQVWSGGRRTRPFNEFYWLHQPRPSDDQEALYQFNLFMNNYRLDQDLLTPYWIADEVVIRYRDDLVSFFRNPQGSG